MFRSRFLLAAAVAVAAALVAPATGQATYRVSIDDGSGAVTIDDGQAGVDLNPAANMITAVISNYNGYTITVSSTSNSPGGTTSWGSAGAEVTQTTLTVEQVGTVASPLTITVFSDGFNVFGTTVPNAVVQNTLTSSTLTTGSSVSLTTTVNPGTGSVATPAATLTAAGGLGAVTYSTPTTLGNPFSVTQTATVNLSGVGAVASFTGNSAVLAPAPTGLVMLAGALPFAALLRLRRRVQTAAPAVAV